MTSFLKNILFAIIALSFASCSNGDETKASTVRADGYTGYPEPVAPAAHNHAVESPAATLPVNNRAGYHTIEIKQMKFFPSVLNVKRGDTVVWVNNGITAHDVTQQPSGAWTSSSIPVGKSWSMIVEESHDYYCSIHVVMTGKMILE